jgi:hypothetical protein
VYARKAYMGNGVWAALILNLSTRWGEWFASRTGSCSPGARALNRRLGGPQNWCGCFGQETKLLPLSETEPQFPTRPGHCIVTIPGTTSNKMFPTLHVNAHNAFSCSLFSLKVRGWRLQE